jgi:hypothetical protein
MRPGILGYKGHIHYQAAPCINEWLDTLPADMPKADYFKSVATHIDEEIFRNYQLYPCNFIALDLLEGTTDHCDHYSEQDKQQFEAYLEKKLGMITLEHPDMPYLRERILTMYANPAKNKLNQA